MTTLTGALDANAIIGLAHGGVFGLLRQVYAALYVPPAVVDEVIAQGSGLPGEPELKAALGTWVIEVVPDPQRVQQFSVPTSIADRELMAVAQERAVDHIISSDVRLQRQAGRIGIDCLPTTLIVVLLKEHGLISEVRSVLDQMRQAGFGIDDAAYEAALRAANEGPTP